jgi:hypothetical protein
MVLGMYLKYIANSMTDHHGSKCISGTVKLHQNSSSYLPELIKIEEFLRPTRVRRGHMAIAIAKIKPNRGICKFLSTNLWKLKLKLSTLNFSLPPAILVDPPRYRHNFSMAKRRPSFFYRCARGCSVTFFFLRLECCARHNCKKLDGISMLAFKAKVASQTWPL